MRPPGQEEQESCAVGPGDPAGGQDCGPRPPRPLGLLPQQSPQPMAGPRPRARHAPAGHRTNLSPGVFHTQPVSQGSDRSDELGVWALPPRPQVPPRPRPRSEPPPWAGDGARDPSAGSRGLWDEPRGPPGPQHPQGRSPTPALPLLAQRPRPSLHPDVGLPPPGCCPRSRHPRGDQVPARTDGRLRQISSGKGVRGGCDISEGRAPGREQAVGGPTGDSTRGTQAVRGDPHPFGPPGFTPSQSTKGLSWGHPRPTQAALARVGPEGWWA